MRRVMWFSVGFFLAVLVGAYCLSVEHYLAAAGVSAVLLASALIIAMRFPAARIAAMVFFASILGFCWMHGFDSVKLSTARAADDLQMPITVIATDYSYVTDYGAAVEGTVSINGKTYRVIAYHDQKLSLKPGDLLHGEFLLRCTLAGTSGDSTNHRSNKIYLTARPRGELTVEVCEKTPWYYYPSVIRSAMLDVIQRSFPTDTAGFACALLLGETDRIDYETDTALKLSGIRHVVAVSGLHVSILFSLIYLVTMRKRWLTALVGLPILFVFAAIAGFSPSITRACIMHSLMVISLLINREYDPPTALAFAVLCMLMADPWTVTNVGFQLSISCMIGIIVFSERIKNYLMDRRRLGRFRGRWRKFAGGFAASVAVSFGALIVTTPLCAYYFGVVSLVGPVTNLLVLWVITWAFYGIILICALGALLPAVGQVLGWIVSWPIRYVLWVADVLADLPLSAVYTQSIYVVAWLVFVYILFVIFMLARRKRPVILACLAVVSLCISLLVSWNENPKDSLRMTVIDVGQGQCILFEYNGRNYLVDCGSYKDTYAADQAAGLLLSRGITRLDGVIITHFDKDHVGGVPYLLTRVSADRLYLPAADAEDAVAMSLYQYPNAEICPVEADRRIVSGDACITLIPSQLAETDNQASVCILFQTMKCDILITGDRDSSGEWELFRHMELPDLEVLIVGHHGSKTSTCRELLIKTTPDIAIISVGEDNSYGHPAQEVLQRLEDFGCIVYRTDRDGTIIFRE